MTCSFLVDGEHGVQQNVHAVLDVLRPREFLRRMADAADARNEDHADRTDARHVLRVVPRAARHRLRAESERACRVGDARADAWIGRRRDVLVDGLVRERRPARLRDGIRLGANARVQLLNLRGIEVAELERADDDAGDHVRRARLGLDAPDGADLPARYARHDPIHRFDELRGREQRVVPLIHRRRAGVVREAGDGDLPLVDADDALDYADVELLAVERTTLLDVQLDVGGDRPALALHARELRRIAADERDAFANGLAAPAHEREARLGQRTDHRLAADEATFLVLEHDDLERMPRDHVPLGQRLRHFDRAERSDIAIVV